MDWTECLIGIGGRTVSGEKTSGDGGCRRGETESAMAKERDGIDDERKTESET